MRSWLLVVILAACGDDSVRRLDDAPLVPDSPPGDAAVSPPAHEITSGAQRVSGSRFSADVQIGHAMSQQPSTGGTKRLDPNSAVKP